MINPGVHLSINVHKPYGRTESFLACDTDVEHFAMALGCEGKPIGHIVYQKVEGCYETTGGVKRQLYQVVQIVPEGCPQPYPEASWRGVLRNRAAGSEACRSFGLCPHERR